MAIYLFSQILKFTLYSIKLIEKLSRRHLINSSDVFVIKGFTVVNLFWVTEPPKCPFSLINIPDSPANPPSGEYALHHYNNLLDANLAKNVSGINKVNC